MGPVLLPLRPVHCGLDTSAGSESVTLTPSDINAPLLAKKLGFNTLYSRTTHPVRCRQQRQQAAVHGQLQLHHFAAPAVGQFAGGRLCRQPESRSAKHRRIWKQHQSGSGWGDAESSQSSHRECEQLPSVCWLRRYQFGHK